MLAKIGIYRIGEKAANKSFVERMLITVFCNTYINLCNTIFSHFTDLNTD